MLFSKPKKSIGLDIGTHSVKAVQMSRSGGRLCVDEVACALVDRNQANADPVNAHASAVREALRMMPPAQCLVVAALPGQTVVIRYPRLTDVAREQMDVAVQREAAKNIPYDLNEVFLDWVLLDEFEEGNKKQLKVLLVAAKHEVISSRLQVLDAAEVQCAVLGVDSLALADAAEGCDFLRVGETVALVNIGLSSASIHFVKDGISNFIRDVSWGSRELVQAIAKERRCEYEEAERLLQSIGQEEEEPPAAIEQAPEEAVPEPIPDENPFAEPGPPPAAGGGSLLDPLDEELGNFGSPLGEAGAARPSMRADAGQRDLPQVLSGPLARMVSEIRRSFDFYEHQLYERPVDRLILSGGVAHLPVVRDALGEEIGVDSIEVADPTSSALFLGDEMATADLRAHPAQFMVAIGLAARGVAGL